MPIVRSDRDIVNLLHRSMQEVNNVIDVFIKSQNSIHLLRAIEPTLRFGRGIKPKYMQQSPKCEFQYSSNDNKCIAIASRRQISEFIVEHEEDKQVK